MDALLGPRRLIPRETLIALVVGSPILAALLSRNVVHGTWSDRGRIIAGIFAYALVTAAGLYAMFEVVLARVVLVQRRRLGRLVLYELAALLVVFVVTILFAPVFEWMEISSDPVRRFLQTGVIVSIWFYASMVRKHMSERVADERNRAIVEREAALRARFQALQARTNPHFLFNALNSVMSLIGRDPQLAESLLARLATLLRYTIEGSEQRHVPLRSELAAVRDYLDIEQVRFGERLSVELVIEDENALAVRIPPMVLQPLVENAILHGVAPSTRGGHVSIHIARASDNLIRLTVDDDGASEAASAHVGTRTSLANLEERLRIVYGKRATLEAAALPGGGFRAQIIVPMQMPAEGVP